MIARRRYLTALAFALGHMMAAAAVAAPVPLVQRLADPRPIIIAHRGCWRGATENSIAGLKSCIQKGIDAAEIDIRTTKDGALVLLHDVDLDRTTNVTGPLSDYKLAQLSKVTLRERNGGPGANLTEEPVPTFAQALRVAKQGLILFLDIKCRDCEDQVRAAVEAEGAQDWVVFIGGMENDFEGRSGWHKRQTLYWINDCREQAAFPRAKTCAATFAEGVEQLGTFRPLFFKNFSRDPHFYAAGITAPALRGVRAVVGTYVARTPGMSDEEFFERTKAQWAIFFKDSAPAIIDDYPDELAAYLRAEGKR